MASTTKDTVWSREQIVEELKALRKSKNYKLSVNLLVKKNYDREEAKAILIYLATTSLDVADQIIVLGAWQLSPGYQNIKRLQDRRIKVKEAIQYKGAPESLDNRENKAFGVIVDSFFDDFSNPERWEIIAQAALKEHYDSEKKEAILPKLPCAVAAESVASTEDTAEKHQTTPTKPNITLEQESKKTVERTAPENDPAESQSSPESSSVEESADDTSSKPQEALVPVWENKPIPLKRRRHRFVRIMVALFSALIIVLIIFAVGMNSIKIDFTVDMKARFEGDITWNEELYHARVGDVVELQSSFLNDRGTLGTIMGSLAKRLGMRFTADDVMLAILLPDNLEYIPSTTIIFNTNHTDGIKIESDDVVANGINIGDYSINGKSFIRISCRIVNSSLEKGENQIVPFVKATVAGVVRHDDGVPINLVY